MGFQLPRRFSQGSRLRLALLLGAFAFPAEASTPAFIQANSATPQSAAVASVTVTFNAAQTAGNLNVVVVGWNDTVAAVSSVTDSAGNVYALAVGPTTGNALTESIYYAKNIAGAASGGNRVTVTFAPAAPFPDVRILEYSGIDPVNAFEAGAGSAGNTANSSTTVNTTNATDLLVGANMVATGTGGPGSGFTSRVITNPDSDIAEDRVVTTAGNYSASAPLTASGPWVMQVAAFRAAGGPVDTTPPTAPANLTANAASASQISLSWTPSTDNVGVAAYLIERCQGSACSGFAQVGTSTGPAFNDNGLAASTTYSYRVRATDAAGNLSGYSNTATATTAAAPSVPTFVQVNSTVPQSSTVSSVALAYTAAQTAGNLNVVVVGWNDTSAAVFSVSDTMGNLYTLAAGPTTGNGLTQSIYYSKNIVGAAAGTNRVTVTFVPAAELPDVRILEYAGIDRVNALEAAVGAAGSSDTSSSGAVTTANATDLLVGANTVATGTSGAGLGFTSRLITSPDGDIVEDRGVTATGRYTATAPLSASGPWVAQEAAFRAAGSQSGPDVTPPMVAILSPANGATAVGFVIVAASASDNIGVAGVQFKVDGGNLGAELTAAPYTVTWDATAVTPGSKHTLSVIARDAAGNTATSSVTVTVQSTNGLGEWQGPFSWPLVAVNMNLMPNGKVLLWDGQAFGSFPEVWNPANNNFEAVPAPDNIFCSGNTSLSDGKVLVVGGHIAAHVGLTASNAFDPVSETWVSGPAMSVGRWYPTVTALPDGRALVLSGESNCNGCDVPQPAIYDPVANSWSVLKNASFTFPYYPHAFVQPDGRVLVSSTTEAPITSQMLDLQAQTWTAIGSEAVDGGTAAMYRPGKILKIGTSVDPDTSVRPSFATAYVLDMTQSAPDWRQVASMAFPRTYATLVLLPDGNVFVAGGGKTTAATDLSGAILQGEIWSSSTETWTTVASMSTPRLYHSTALLMPDGRVLVAGGGRFDTNPAPTDQLSAEYYLPPYFFKGPRPTIASTLSTLHFNQAFLLQTPDAPQIGSVVLMRLGSVTHNINMSQSYVPLTFQVTSGGLSVQSPPNGNIAAPGYYMLFIVNTNGVPSVASIVNLTIGSGSAQAPLPGHAARRGNTPHARPQYRK
jgi:chitodextrinase